MTTLSIDRNLELATRFTARLKHSRVPALLRRVLEAVDFCARGVFHVWRNRRYLTLIKLANMAMVNIQFRFKTERVLGRPYRLKIESTNICNTKCQLCPTGIGLQARPRGKMSLDQYKRLVDQLRRYTVALDLSMWGDPLIVPEIFDMIRYAHDRGVWTYISSNLHAFKPEKKQAEALVNSGLDLLTCSLHGASQATYEKYQPGKSFADAVEKIRHILAVRDAMGSATPRVQLNFVVTRHNEHERDAFEALARELGCKAVFSAASLNVRFLDRDQKMQPLNLAPDLLAKKTRQHVSDWLPQDSRYIIEPYRKILETGELRGEQYNGHKLFDCSWPWKQSVINWDGTVATCCGSFETREDMGSVLDQPFSKIWNSEKYRMARRSFKKKLTDAHAKDNPCATCPGYML